MRDVLNSEEFAEETETQCYTTHTVQYMFKHRLWNLNGLACGRLTINVGDLDLICLCREWRINVFLCFREFPCVWSPVTYQVTNRDEVKLSFILTL